MRLAAWRSVAAGAQHRPQTSGLARSGVASGQQSGRYAAEGWLFCSLVAVTILPVWTTTCFPSRDGPVHLSIAHLLRQLLAGDDGIGAHSAREQDLVYMRGSLLSRHAFGDFPVVYRETTDPFLHIVNAERLDGELRCVRFADFAARSEGLLDDLLLWPVPVEALDDPLSEAIPAQVTAYRQPLTLPPAATGALFRRQDENRATHFGQPLRRVSSATRTGAARPRHRAASCSAGLGTIRWHSRSLAYRRRCARH